ncbi:retropepsin-like aspartic protease [Hephaestia mangrovi]|uniref:retropepsin-like aspartic protease n=1 Tax=Hephaestia mangrovi TaxID=2873268 RepID=UPI001CA68E1C|nr:retropepsin-like aspartic protease [Hephaestia mangrovi]MBY8829841.1 retropepsin-like domain-containing protein [Hephaestia mangrovi]
MILLASIAAVAIDPARASEPAAPVPSVVSNAGGSDNSGWVPFDLYNGHLFLIAKVNGHDVPAVLDSGSSVVVVNAPDAARLGIAASGTEMGHGAHGSAKSDMARHVLVTVGAADIRSDKVALVEMTAMAKALNRPLTTAIGGEFFKNAVVKIDFAHRD